MTLLESCAHMNTPFLLVDETIAKENCDRMRKIYDDLGIKLRPHMKTHKTL